ncbi:MAG TPA: hypothetical protein VGP11_07690 [Acidimicrobiales bacterium]|jgi:hypothetical protein|nr:hypothetical protein [Acidimicrobiales bacterium]
MKQFVVRGLVVLGLVTSLGLGVSAVASAGNGPGTVAPTMRVYRQEMTAYKASRAAIEATFRSSVATATATYDRTLSSATTSAQRSVAQQTRVQAIIDAAATRSSALTTLGSAPLPPTA